MVHAADSPLDETQARDGWSPDWRVAGKQHSKLPPTGVVLGSTSTSALALETSPKESWWISSHVMARLTGSSAVLLVFDLEHSASYYRDMLGFECQMYGDPPDFMSASRDDVVVLMALCREPHRSCRTGRSSTRSGTSTSAWTTSTGSPPRSNGVGLLSTTPCTTRHTAFASSASPTPMVTTLPSDSDSLIESATASASIDR